MGGGERKEDMFIYYYFIYLIICTTATGGAERRRKEDFFGLSSTTFVLGNAGVTIPPFSIFYKKKLKKIHISDIRPILQLSCKQNVSASCTNINLC